MVRALLESIGKVTAAPLHQLIDSILATDPAAIQNVADSWFTCALAERDAAAAERAILAMGQNPFSIDIVFINRQVTEGFVARMTKDEAKARGVHGGTR